ncbi:hypothetical protein C453_00675 [Haloferax elongans ATCC BAA-1513]|uniref:eCIS core domain-containing protein n=2 Tax=Haloferax elongans TaxID=403191 RepID=M0HY86_HALEO|nr:hypothetical protein C453_00675 [Haloferax elongans ATCC BAA-1513]
MDVQIQRLVESHGASQVRQWADEGMTVETMGKPRDMREFRERQEEHPAEVPKDIERRNAKSVQRSRGAHHEASKAGDSQVPDSVRDVISAPGQQLDTSIQRAMEERMGDNLGDVRIHTGPSAAKACEDINARAFTVGNHIAFNHGEYDPDSPEGQHVLAHELAHVRQQTGAAVSMLPQKGELEIDPDPRLEREAEETAERVMRGGKLGIHRMQQSDVHVQRMPDAVTASNAKNIQEINAELTELKQTVQSHDETIKEIESMRQAVDDAYDDVDPNDVQLDIPGSQDQKLSTLDKFKAKLGNMGNKMNPFSESGQKTLSKGTVGGGLALGAFAMGGGPLGVAAATLSPILGDTVAAGIGDSKQAVPDEIVEKVGKSLAASENFARRIAGDPKLASQLASNETLLNNLKTGLQSGEEQTSGTRFDADGGEI